ncbi:hypothetical protein Taro_042435 [Colocasia esculenta]|uniref:DYW domain-containing protein n=1 Tax=Colocasia esculenta TaxID=4460 RepID=A0A843WZK6_COLES|nr:hypothetical protein [Colocasia esculenta]
MRSFDRLKPFFKTVAGSRPPPFTTASTLADLPVSVSASPAEAKKKKKKRRRRKPSASSESSSAAGPSETAEIVRWNKEISGHMRWGRCEEALRVFEGMPHRTTVSWNAMISGYISNGRFDLAVEVFRRMPRRDRVSWNAMISGYVRNGDLGTARRLFDEMPERDTVSWNAMISAYALNGHVEAAREMFDRAPVKNAISWNGVLAAYVQNGRLEAARRLFDSNPEWETVSWNAMIAGYVQRRRLEEARELFDRMPRRDVVSWNTMVSGYAQMGELGVARLLFDRTPVKDVEQARKLFDHMPQHDSISWAAMIAGYSQGGLSEEALRLFIDMGRQGERYNRSTYTCALSTCADIAALECGSQVHGRLVKAGYETGCFVGNALLAMYCKCGSIDEAYETFMGMIVKDVVTWNTMIAGYARHGFGREALEIFDWMLDTNTKPDDVTLVGVLSACSHTGLVEKGMQYFYSMHDDFSVTPKAQHYTCMIDLLGRAGRLEDAQDLMRNMPFEPDATMWGALLGASRVHGNAKLGEEAARRIFEMEPDNSGMYVLLSNLYASSGKWNDVRKMRVMMRDKGVRKVPGFSWIEVQNIIHTFSVGDSEHPQKEKIYAFLEDLDLRMRKAGYVSSTKMVLHDVEEEEKEHMLKYHSEKLAVAFGILNVPSGRPIRVIKNLRVCEDCHNAIKYISAIESRLIILRDSNRFHHFSNGSCSCGDYW